MCEKPWVWFLVRHICKENELGSEGETRLSRTVSTVFVHSKANALVIIIIIVSMLIKHQRIDPWGIGG